MTLKYRSLLNYLKVFQLTFSKTLLDETKDPRVGPIAVQVAKMSLNDADEGLSFEQQNRQHIETFYPGKTVIVRKFVRKFKLQ